MQKTLTAEQLEALKEYANDYGRNWKGHLRLEWETGQTTPILQQIRNQFGPTWLTRFKLPKTPAQIDLESRKLAGYYD